MNKELSPTSWGQVQLSCVPIRARPSHTSELVNQLLYQETYTILEQQEEWSYIKSSHDHYMGWMANNQLCWISQTIFEQPFRSYQTALAHWDNARQMFYYMGSPSYQLPLSEEKAYLSELVCTYAHSFINTPYLWGGRTCTGIDCSGLVQLVFRMVGKLLPRDASQQALLGSLVSWGTQQMGDLAFFKNKKGKITHVGLLLGAQNIVHASAWVRVDELTSNGILHQKQLTHQLAFIKRLL